MCDPVTATIATAAITVASTAASTISSIKSANRQEAALRDQMAQAREETKDVASAELFDSMRQARREQGKARAQAGESGLSLASGSVEALLLDSAMQSELREDRIIGNMESRHRSNMAEAESMASRIQKPTALGAGLQIGGAAAQGFSSIQAAKIRTN
ncbi:hypothetical protein QQS45_08445 [Alteriqipengyuania flavescens]|uniref:virion core protein, T7 gp14 family n=1 Tax=Alteriqipengyuania flavescens TaxID=3053610 RepID=UPI0025B4EE5A|nr:hypothetical protein [Alteriqipengyuania flavescens]WJY17676.1 hypothetical protein QQW98_08440 [Alteriqipengyuania flavescens]WJY23619.1 hypothetical protein QQS45_08445 [Alteriqipengyuania flavescens]